MSLIVREYGQGTPVVFVHGWAMHGGLFSDLFDALDGVAARRVDLPGHGRNRDLAWPDDDPYLCTALLEAAGAGGWLAGWSLGGLLAMKAALHRPGFLGGLILIAATPCFVQRAGWPHGVEPELFAALGRELDQRPEDVLNRFLALEAHGSADAAAQLRRLRGEAFRHGLPRAAALRHGLALLQREDLSAALPRLDLPLLITGGRRDRLVSPAALEAAARATPGARLEVLPGSAHAPFLTHPDRMAALISAFVHGD